MFHIPDFQHTDGIIFVVDSVDHVRISEAREELKRLLNTDILLNTDLLVLANKQDLPHAMNIDAIVDHLGLRGLERKWHVQVSWIDA